MSHLVSGRVGFAVRALALSICLARTSAAGEPARLDSPEFALRTYVAAVNDHDSETLRQVYALELTSQSFTFPKERIDSYRITKREVVDDARAKAWNDKGIVPAAQAGDVELTVEESFGGKPLTFSYSLRRFGDRWRIYAHSEWEAQ
jgi:hypothetical protein